MLIDYSHYKYYFFFIKVKVSLIHEAKSPLEVTFQLISLKKEKRAALILIIHWTLCTDLYIYSVGILSPPRKLSATSQTSFLEKSFWYWGYLFLHFNYIFYCDLFNDFLDTYLRLCWFWLYNVTTWILTKQVYLLKL